MDNELLENQVKKFIELLTERDRKLKTNAKIYYEFTAQWNRKYIRIVRRYIGEKSQTFYCFIDMTTGDILPGGWCAPVKGARGNIFNADLLQGTDEYGVKYLKGGGLFNHLFNIK